MSFQALASEEDYEATAAFFKVSNSTSGVFTVRRPRPLIRCVRQDKDTSGYDLALKQSLDNIRTRAAWIKVRSRASTSKRG